MRVLVTGTDGYIGIVLASFLLKRGYDVMGLDTGFYRDAWLYNKGVGTLPSVKNKDLRHMTADDVAGMDAVVHLAELSNDPLGQLSPHITYAINHQGSVALAQLCKAVGVPRFVYTSSCSVYGIGGGSEYKTETATPQPQTAYAECKVLVERDVSAMADATFSPTFLRNATAYGPSPRMRFDLMLNNLAGLAWTTKKIHMTSDGTPWRPLVHVLDICEAIACTLEAPREVVHNEIFNVGITSENYQVREVAEIVSEVFPGCDLVFGTNDGDNRSYRVSFDKIAAHLPGFQCRRDVTLGARELHAVFERIGMSRDIFESRAYTRLKQIQHLCATSQLDEHFFWNNS
jgi:nucleoside-diphosphate-sugar epimerase